MKKRLIPVLSVLFCLFMFTQSRAQDMGGELISNADGSYTFTWPDGTSISTNTDGHFSLEDGQGTCSGCLPLVVVVGYYNQSTGTTSFDWNIPESEITEADYLNVAAAETMVEMVSYNNNAGASVQAPSQINVVSGPKIDLHQLFKCFDQVPSAGATYSVSLCVDIPVNSNPYALTDGSLNTGHTFITMTKTNGSSSVTQSFGFYPDKSVISVFDLPVSSKMNDNGGHEYDASVTMSNISEIDFLSLQNMANNASSMQYDLNDYNCTDYALQVFNYIRPDNPIVVPDWIGPNTGINFGTTPNGLYLVMGNVQATKSNVSLGTANAPASHGLCN